MTSFLTQAREWRREQVLFGDTTDKDRPSARGEEREWRWQRGGGKIKLLVTISTGLYLKRHLFCLSSGSLDSQKSLDSQSSIQSFSGYILTTLLGNRWIQDGNGVNTDERGNGVSGLWIAASSGQSRIGLRLDDVLER